MKHLDRYIGEFQFRWNSRQDVQIFAAVIIGLVINDALRYKALTGATDAAASLPTASEPDEEMPF